jgi:hypothetical protein
MIPAKSDHVERLWTSSDGTTCVLVTGDRPPRYAVTLVRDEQVVRERRLYGRASAQMVAEGWSEFGQTRARG